MVYDLEIVKEYTQRVLLNDSLFILKLNNFNVRPHSKDDKKIIISVDILKQYGRRSFLESKTFEINYSEIEKENRIVKLKELVK